MSINQTIVSANSVADGYEPFIVEGEPTGQLSLVAGRQDVQAGMFRVEPGRYPDGTPVDYLFEMDEYFLVVEGTVDIIERDGQRTTLSAGDAAFFRAGTENTWVFHAPFRKFSVEIDKEA